MMRRTTRLLLLPLAALLALALISPRARADTEENNLVVGGQKTFPADGIQNYSVSNPKIMQVVVSTDGRTLVAKALKPGTVTLVLIHENKAEPDRTIAFNIFARDPKAVMAELNDILRNYPDVQARVNGPQIVLQGSVRTQQEETRLKEVEKNYAGQVLSLVTVGPAGARRNVMVRLDMHYVQIIRRVQRQFGLHYPASLGNASSGGTSGASSSGPQFTLTANLISSKDPTTGNVTPAGIQTAQYSIVTDLLPWLDITESSGYVRILRTDTLVTENGAEAKYRDGSELNIVISGGLAQARLEKIFFGSELTVTPSLSASNDAISLKLEAELSQKDNVTLNAIPGRLLDKVETNVHLPIGQSIMVAGVRAKSSGKTTTGLPWLNRIPILGYLFGSENYSSEDVDAVLFITPTLIQASSPDNLKRIDDALKHFEDP